MKEIKKHVLFGDVQNFISCVALKDMKNINSIFRDFDHVNRTYKKLFNENVMDPTRFQVYVENEL